MKRTIVTQLLKTAVLNLVFSTAVFPCSMFPSGAADELARQAEVFAGLGTLLLVANASLLLFLRKRYWLCIFAGVAAVTIQFISVAATIIYGDSCMDMTHKFVRAEIILLSLILIVQIGAYLLLRRNDRLK